MKAKWEAAYARMVAREIDQMMLADAAPCRKEARVLVAPNGCARIVDVYVDKDRPIVPHVGIFRRRGKRYFNKGGFELWKQGSKVK